MPPKRRDPEDIYGPGDKDYLEMRSRLEALLGKSMTAYEPVADELYVDNWRLIVWWDDSEWPVNEFRSWWPPGSTTFNKGNDK